MQRIYRCKMQSQPGADVEMASSIFDHQQKFSVAETKISAKAAPTASQLGAPVRGRVYLQSFVQNDGTIASLRAGVTLKTHLVACLDYVALHQPALHTAHVRRVTSTAGHLTAVVVGDVRCAGFAALDCDSILLSGDYTVYGSGSW
jgi:hypothetical protein